MPPRKRAKGRAPSSPIADDDPMAIDSPQPAKSKETPQTKYDILKEPWTDEQESSLFKGLMKWKLNGMHKHFRMIALSEYLRNHGYDPRVDTHTRIPGIWQKLRTLYNMPIIDDRENSFEYDEEVQDTYNEFELPPEDYDVITFMRGKRSTSSETSKEGSPASRSARSPSPEVTQPTRKRKRGETISNTKTRASTVDDTDEARTSPAHSPPSKATRSGRSTTRAAGRAAVESLSRQASRETTIDEAAGEAEEEDAEVDEETEEDGSNSPKTSRASRSKADPPVTRRGRRKRQ